MYKFSRIINTLTITVFCAAFAASAHAQATRTWVSGVGDDANPCSRTAPCKTFAGAISKTASPGEISTLDPGGFGAVTITKSVTIDGGEGQIAGVLASGTQGIVINAGINDVVILRNLDIDGAGTTLGTNGINIIAAKAVYIEHCHIYNFSQNAIIDNRTAIQSPPPQLFVSDCLIRANGNGIAIASTHGESAFVDRCRIYGNGAFGVSASNNSVINVTHCEIDANGGEGVKIDTGAQANVIGCIINGNLTGVLNSTGAILTLADTTIINSGLAGASGAITSFGNNNVRNNGTGNTLPAPVGQQ